MRLIEGGTRFAESIDEALQKADAVVVLWSKQSIESDWVRDEAAQGRDRHRLVPLSLDGSMPPLGFRQIQMIDLSGWRGRADAPQIEAIRRAIAAAIGQPPVPAAPRCAPINRRRALALGGGAPSRLPAAGLVAWQTGLFDRPGPGQRPQHRRPALQEPQRRPGQAYLSDGLTEEIRSALVAQSRAPGAGRTTSSNTVA